MIVRVTNTNGARLDFPSAMRRGAPMAYARDEFRAAVVAILERFAAQTGEPALEASVAVDIADRLLQIVERQGLPPPLPDGESGEPGGMAELACATFVREALGGDAVSPAAEPLRQIVKACFHPEFRNCRNSFREVSADGKCRRQDLARARRRVSGAPCVDCPYWVQLDAAAHAKLLLAHAAGSPAEIARHLDVFLPEDFRRLRQWRHAAARCGGSGLTSS